MSLTSEDHCISHPKIGYRNRLFYSVFSGVGDRFYVCVDTGVFDAIPTITFRTLSVSYDLGCSGDFGENDLPTANPGRVLLALQLFGKFLRRLEFHLEFPSFSNIPSSSIPHSCFVSPSVIPCRFCPAVKNAMHGKFRPWENKEKNAF